MEPNKERFRKTLNTLASSGQFIPGIYNYCDRWCERCLLSHKCLTYAHEQEIWNECKNPASNALNNEKFWEQISLSFEVALDMITEDAKRFGIEMEGLPEDPIPNETSNPVGELALSYGTAMGKWLEVNNIILEDKGEQLLNIYNRKEPALKFADAVEVLKWYCFYIEAKVCRSFYELNERLQEEDDEFDVIADNLGSAKVAIIAIDRSIEALTVLYPELNAQEDDILKFLSKLSELKSKMLKAFPTAMEFKRPGFDD